MVRTHRRVALFALPLGIAALVLLAGCSSPTGTGTGNEVSSFAVSASDTSSDAVGSSSAAGQSSAAPTQANNQSSAPVTRTTPAAAPSTNMANPGPFTGDWKGTGNAKTLEVSSDGSANVAYLVGVLCSSKSPSPSPCDNDNGSPTTPGGQLKLHITMVVTTGSTAVATALVKDSTDPKHPENSTLTFTLNGTTATSSVGTYVKS